MLITIDFPDDLPKDVLHQQVSAFEELHNLTD